MTALSYPERSPSPPSGMARLDLCLGRQA
ncbi:MAG: hypothetical protein MZU79_03500 [Anaerotruncus sp.]|nr:hypothetical protein [Anaerotruncus sp.]